MFPHLRKRKTVKNCIKKKKLQSPQVLVPKVKTKCYLVLFLFKGAFKKCPFKAFWDHCTRGEVINSKSRLGANKHFHFPLN